MSVRRAGEGKPFVTPSGEIVDEIFGAVGGTKQHSLAHIRLPPGKKSDNHYHPTYEVLLLLLLLLFRYLLNLPKFAG